MKYIFRPENLLLDYVGTQDHYEEFISLAGQVKKSLHTEPVEHRPFLIEPVRKNEGFMSASQVQYVCRAGNFISKGLSYTGVLRVLKVMMSYEYLWQEVRVKGGAYGCMCAFGKSGDSYFVSYRDPNLKSTVQVYERAAAFVEGFDGDEEDHDPVYHRSHQRNGYPHESCGKGAARHERLPDQSDLRRLSAGTG